MVFRLNNETGFALFLTKKLILKNFIFCKISSDLNALKSYTYAKLATIKRIEICFLII